MIINTKIKPSPINFQVKTTLVFDWDGTLLDSAAIKADNFVEVIYTELRDLYNNHQLNLDKHQIRALYKKYVGHPRHTLITRICDELPLATPSSNIDNMVSNFSSYNLKALSKAQVFPDAIKFLNNLIAKTHYNIYISSGTKQDELDYLVQEKLLNKLANPQAIQGVFGSSDNFQKGKEHLQKIMDETNAAPNNLLIFGDDATDAILAIKNNIDYLLVDRCRQYVNSAYNTVSSFIDCYNLLVSG